MRRVPAMAVMLLVLAPVACLAQDGENSQPSKPDRWNVKITTNDGKTFEGVLKLQRVQVQTEIGNYLLRTEKVKEIVFDKAILPPTVGRLGGPLANTPTLMTGKVITHSDEEIEGSVYLGDSIEIATDLGYFYPNLTALKSIIFLKKASDD